MKSDITANANTIQTQQLDKINVSWPELFTYINMVFPLVVILQCMALDIHQFLISQIFHPSHFKKATTFYTLSFLDDTN